MDSFQPCLPSIWRLEGHVYVERIAQSTLGLTYILSCPGREGMLGVFYT